MSADYVLVPKVLTEDMHVAAVRAIVRATGNGDFPPAVWAAMLAAAPAATPASAQPVEAAPAEKPCGWLAGGGNDGSEPMFYRLDAAQRECDEHNTYERTRSDFDAENLRKPEPVYRAAPAAPVAQAEANAGGATTEVLRALSDARALAMKNVLAARIPECGDFGDIAQNLDWAIGQLTRDRAPATTAPVAPQGAPAEDAKDAARYRWIEENCRTEGGGHGFTIFVPVDAEDIGCGIDAAMASQQGAKTGGAA